MASISLHKLVKSYGSIQVVNGIDLDIAPNEFVVLVGPSGCGKSTTLRMIAGLEDISDGEIKIDDVVVNDQPPRKRNISMVFQNYALYPHMSVRENLGFGLKIAKMDTKSIIKRVDEAAQMLGLESLMDRTPAELSGGQRQRVAMGRAIVRRPGVFLFDEPLSNLDAKLRVQMRAEIKKLHQQVQTTVVYVTHDQVEAMTMADRIVVMKNGYIEQMGTPMEVFTRPVNTFVASFIGSPPMNLIEGEVRRGKLVLTKHQSVAIPDQFKNRVHEGQQIIFGIRPDDITPVGHGIQERGQSAKLSLQVELAEPLGTETLIYLWLGDNEIQGKMFNPRAVRSGENLEFRLALDKAHIFDAVTKASVSLD